MEWDERRQGQSSEPGYSLNGPDLCKRCKVESTELSTQKATSSAEARREACLAPGGELAFPPRLSFSFILDLQPSGEAT